MTRNNFCWIATWKITDRCNLRCSYCDPSIMKRADAAEDIDRFAALDRIAAHKPKVLNISGGEPALVKELPDLLRRAKELWNPSVRVVHNGTAPQKLKAAFPYVDRLVISVDGPGGINTATRGMSGDVVLERIAKLLAETPSCPEMCVNTVVTENNLTSLPMFAAQIEAVSPRIVLALLPVMPVDSPQSVLRNGEEGYARFLNVYEEMAAAHRHTVHNLDCVMRHGDLRKIQCYNQYFTIRFSPCGEMFSCGAGIASQLRRTDGAFKKIFKKGGVKKLFTMIMKSVKGRMGGIDFTCRNMCNCESWLDMLLLGQETGYAPITLRGLRGRLSDDDYKELDVFVKTNINSSFDVDWFRALADGVSTGEI